MAELLVAGPLFTLPSRTDRNRAEATVNDRNADPTSLTADDISSVLFDCSVPAEMPNSPSGRSAVAARRVLVSPRQSADTALAMSGWGVEKATTPFVCTRLPQTATSAKSGTDLDRRKVVEAAEFVLRRVAAVPLWRPSRRSNAILSLGYCFRLPLYLL